MLRKNLIKIGALTITTFNCINVLSNLTVVKADQLPSTSTFPTSANFDNNKSDINKADIYSDQTKIKSPDYSTVEEMAKKLDSENPLGVASTFHIFSKNANLNADTNGNIATKNLDSHVDFGTRGNNKTVNHTDEDIHYIENINNIDSMNHNAFRNTHDHVVLGNKMTVNVNQDHRVVINQDGKETYIESNNLSQDEIHVLDKDHKYIDIDTELNKLALKSNNWNKKTNSEGVKIDLHDMNNQIIDIRNAKADDNNLIYVNLDSHLLAQPQPIKIKGLENGKKENPIVIINVKSDTHKLNVATQTLLFYRDSNQTINNSESHTEKNYLLWNFGTNIDKINFNSGRFMGSILAPYAEISANVNIDGNIVGDTVNISGGESHRWDLTNNGYPSFPNDDYIINPPDPDDQREHPVTPIAPHDDTILNHKHENDPVLDYDLPKLDLDKLKKKDSGTVLDYNLPKFDLDKLKKKDSGTVLDYDLPKFDLDKLKKKKSGPVLDYKLPKFDLDKLKKRDSGTVLDYDLPKFDLDKLKKKDSGTVLDYDLPKFDLDKLKKKKSGPVLDYDLPTFDLNKLKKKNSGTVLDYDLPKFDLDKPKKEDSQSIDFPQDNNENYSESSTTNSKPSSQIPDSPQPSDSLDSTYAFYPPLPKRGQDLDESSSTENNRNILKSKKSLSKSRKKSVANLEKMKHSVIITHEGSRSTQNKKELGAETKWAPSSPKQETLPNTGEHSTSIEVIIGAFLILCSELIDIKKKR